MIIQLNLRPWHGLYMQPYVHPNMWVDVQVYIV